jgi:hypothetical protein
LRLPYSPVHLASEDQLGMLPRIDDRPFFYHENSVRPQDCRWTMRNHHKCPSLAKQVQSLKQFGGARFGDFIVARQALIREKFKYLLAGTSTVAT